MSAHTSLDSFAQGLKDLTIEYSFAFFYPLISSGILLRNFVHSAFERLAEYEVIDNGCKLTARRIIVNREANTSSFLELEFLFESDALYELVVRSNASICTVQDIIDRYAENYGFEKSYRDDNTRFEFVDATHPTIKSVSGYTFNLIDQSNPMELTRLENTIFFSKVKFVLRNR